MVPIDKIISVIDEFFDENILPVYKYGTAKYFKLRLSYWGARSMIGLYIRDIVDGKAKLSELFKGLGFFKNGVSPKTLKESLEFAANVKKHKDGFDVVKMVKEEFPKATPWINLSLGEHFCLNLDGNCIGSLYNIMMKYNDESITPEEIEIEIEKENAESPVPE